MLQNKTRTHNYNVAKNANSLLEVFDSINQPRCFFELEEMSLELIFKIIK